MKRMLFVLGILVTFSSTFQLVATAKEAELTSAEGYRIYFYYDVEKIDGNGRSPNYTIMKNLHINVYHNSFLSNPQFPGAIDLYWYRTCNFDQDGVSGATIHQHFPFEWTYSRGFGYFLVSNILESQTLASTEPGDSSRECHWTQEVELRLFDKTLIDPVNHSTRFKLNFNY